MKREEGRVVSIACNHTYILSALSSFPYPDRNMPSCVQCCAVLLLCCVVLLVLVAMPSFALEAPPRERLILQLDTYAMVTPPKRDRHMRVGRN